LRVEARVSPRVLRISDNAAELRILVVVTNPTGQDIVVITGGPPYSMGPDPAESRGLTQSFRIATAEEPLNAGPSVDSWGEPVDTIRARRGEYIEHVVKLSEWRQGWRVAPGDYRVRSYYNGRERRVRPLRAYPVVCRLINPSGLRRAPLISTQPADSPATTRPPLAVWYGG
jgi:hypothetical protein